jgi:hypothetical protein
LHVNTTHIHAYTHIQAYYPYTSILPLNKMPLPIHHLPPPIHHLPPPTHHPYTTYHPHTTHATTLLAYLTRQMFVKILS